MMWKDAHEQGCELFITGEMTHHHILAARQSGISILLAGHTNTERGYLPRLRTRLSKILPDASFILSSVDHDYITLG